MAPGVNAGEHRRLPVCSAQVEDFIRDKRKQVHRGNVNRARTLINNGWSRREEEKLATSRRNAKREQIEDERRADIKRENVRLLLRMQAIGERAVLPPAPILQQPPPPPRVQSLPEIRQGSNVGVRMRELRRIDTENLKFLQRLRAAKPTVSVSRLEQEHQAKHKLMKMRCEFQGSSASVPRPRHSEVRYWEQPPVGGGDIDSECGDGATCHEPSYSSSSCARLPPLVGGSCQPSEAVKHDVEDRLETGVDTVDATEAENRRTGDAADGDRGSELDGDRRSSAAGGDDEDHVELNRYGLLIPKASRLLTERLLEQDAQERSAEADAVAAKEAAARAFREATAVDANSTANGGGELLSYDGVVRRLEDRGRKAVSTRTSQARAEVVPYVRA